MEDNKLEGLEKVVVECHGILRQVVNATPLKKAEYDLAIRCLNKMTEIALKGARSETESGGVHAEQCADTEAKESGSV